ncbi:Mediator of RNA polymerase II transcription subunit 12-like protein [Chelonia mydas]|uniref:Mediator of RNA polymerase II transcription subunit 12-like protein n=1 Tax=Chelonia mydas TaxID=8469 RepID=M7BL94_CHEMY|nr:Mediator of RNA polymerase II transcription subunit 12-like protein [Chelonia mydas]
MADALPSTLPAPLALVVYRSQRESARQSIYCVWIGRDKLTPAGLIAARRSSGHYRKEELKEVLKEDNKVAPNDEAVVTLLCEWAVSCKRSGKHRAMAVAKLLEKRQAEIEAELGRAFGTYSFGTLANEQATMPFSIGVYIATPAISSTISFGYYVLGCCIADPNSGYEKTEFVNLVLLFCEFIRHDVFSHDAYMCTLISRGDLSVTATTRPRSPTGETVDEHYSKDHDVKLEEHSIMEHMGIDSGTTNIFDDVDKSDFKTDFGSEFPIFSPMPGESCENVNCLLEGRILVNSEKSVKREKLRELIFPSSYDLLRHLQYATHFPIPLVKLSNNKKIGNKYHG